MWTNVETVVTTISITAVRLSNIKPKDTVKVDRSIQVHKCKYVGQPLNPTSYKIKYDVIQVKRIQQDVKIPAPFSPTLRPNRPATTLLKSGKNKTNIYIKNSQVN